MTRWRVATAAAAAVAAAGVATAASLAAAAATSAAAVGATARRDGPHAHLPLLDVERRALAERIRGAPPGEPVHFDVAEWLDAMKNYHVELSAAELDVLARGGTHDAVTAGLEGVRLAGLASVRAVPAPFTNGLCTTDYRTRKEVGDMWAGERWAWTQAMLALHRLQSPGNVTAYEQLVILHRANSAQAHGSVQFLPWHYFFLIILETALRAIDPTVTLPYWAWSRDAAAPHTAPVWGDWFLGKTVSGECITTGPFANWTTNTPTAHCVLRGFTSGPAPAGFMDFPVEDEATVDALVANGNLSFADWAETWEIAHGGPHIAIGGLGVRGDMFRVSRSPNDPAFYVHHAYVEKVWRARQAAHGYAYTGLHAGAPVSVNDVLVPFDLPVWRAVWDRCVWYQPTRRAFPGGAPTPSGRTSRSARARKAAILKQFFRENGVLANVAKVDKAQEVLAQAADDAAEAAAAA